MVDVRVEIPAAGGDPPGGDLLAFAGDLYLSADRGPRAAGDCLDVPLLEILHHSCFAMVNLEGPCGLGDRLLKSGPSLRQHPDAVRLARELGFHAVGLANNHIMDFGAGALRQTLEACRQAGLQTCGAGLDEEAALAPLRWTAPSGWRLAVLSVCEREFGIAQADRAGAAWLRPEVIERLVAQLRSAADLVVVCAHGGVETVPVPPLERRRMLRRLGEAGADVVIGHHAHVAQGWEQWKGSLIFYGLGDFYMDPVWGVSFPERDWSYLVRLAVRDGRLAGAQVIPFEKVGSGLRLLGTSRSPDRCRRYLAMLNQATADEQLPALWQEIAVDLFFQSHLPWLAAALPAVQTWAGTWRGRARETLRAVRLLARLWTTGQDADKLSPADSLRLLNSLRCESHRWVAETALSVLGGESVDLRTPETRRAWAEITRERSLRA
jgi:poly-gamma-glutamate synthesis protein (capsule biosynthesis protein)